MSKRLFLYDVEEGLRKEALGEEVLPEEVLRKEALRGEVLPEKVLSEAKAAAQGGEEDLFFSASPRVHSCTGCFGCWIKTPGRCVIRDRCSVLPTYLAQSREVVIVSPILYGGYSAKIKAVLDRCIGYMLPYFRIVGGEMHHQMRCGNSFLFHVHFYGACDEREKETARRLVKANAVNLGAREYSVTFHESSEDLGEVWK